jgi:hypothetical protein
MVFKEITGLYWKPYETHEYKLQRWDTWYI